MMDPKMDAGMIGNQVNRKVLNFEQAIKVLDVKHKQIFLDLDIYIFMFTDLYVFNVKKPNQPSPYLYYSLMLTIGRCYKGKGP